MDDVAIARALHVAAVVLWIGGVAFVTTVVLPLVRRVRDPAERFALFHAIEGRFVWQARAAILVVGLSGLYMLDRLDLWDRFTTAAFWWMHAMVLLWAVFAFVLFVGEPLIFHRWLDRHALSEPDRTFALLHRLHWLLLIVSMLTVLAAVAGSAGMGLLP
ncbi:hypothetical protein GCM10011611_35770 [Aliidongia dinghuensis]|uniref:Copper resistance protein D domain-containing protein n=1 Tax=Aliidongia dinghuensis TaxID=1867774 RepID=A0A8J2YWX3_9PROT|nr:hypothetical protein [Aliidongia dinghuensis]GGF26570.1 hypothetical protein GCM10011611_35770 [Aliidongia dinghuensis]